MAHAQWHCLRWLRELGFSTYGDITPDELGLALASVLATGRGRVRGAGLGSGPGFDLSPSPSSYYNNSYYHHYPGVGHEVVDRYIPVDGWSILDAALDVVLSQVGLGLGLGLGLG